MNFNWKKLNFNWLKIPVDTWKSCPFFLNFSFWWNLISSLHLMLFFYLIVWHWCLSRCTLYFIACYFSRKESQVSGSNLFLLDFELLPRNCFYCLYVLLGVFVCYFSCILYIFFDSMYLLVGFRSNSMH